MKLKDCIEKIIDNRGKNPVYLEEGAYPIIDNVMIKNNFHPNIKEATRYIDKDTHDNFLRGYLESNLPIMTLVGGGIGNVSLSIDDKSVIVQNTIGFKTKKDILDSIYLYYWFLYKHDEIIQYNRGSGQPSIRKTDIENMNIELKDISYQKKVTKILSEIDSKIDINNQINNNLLEQIKRIYNEIFTQYNEYKRLDEISNVTIGKTPPRSEQECFTTDKRDIKWISISDLGKSGMFVFDTSEKLTRDAVEKYNVKVIPEDTVLLSFKLTVGRTGFTTENMTTNEAIAHFDLFDKKLNNYLYCYLTYFSYSDLGSTSSIATAINSKIVKSIKIGIPTKDQLDKFNKLTYASFNLVKNNEKENINLSELRDTLLPKLMNGEIDLENIEI